LTGFRQIEQFNGMLDKPAGLGQFIRTGQGMAACIIQQD
jgi:hypothetical protein